MPRAVAGERVVGSVRLVRGKEEDGDANKYQPRGLEALPRQRLFNHRVPGGGERYVGGFERTGILREHIDVAHMAGHVVPRERGRRAERTQGEGEQLCEPPIVQGAAEDFSGPKAQ